MLLPFATCCHSLQMRVTELVFESRALRAQIKGVINRSYLCGSILFIDDCIFFYAFIEKQDSMIKNSSITHRTSAEKSEKLVSVTLNERFIQKLTLFFLFAKKHFYNDRSLTKMLASKTASKSYEILVFCI